MNSFGGALADTHVQCKLDYINYRKVSNLFYNVGTSTCTSSCLRPPQPSTKTINVLVWRGLSLILLMQFFKALLKFSNKRILWVSYSNTTILYYSISERKEVNKPKGHDCTTIGLPAKQSKSSKKPKKYQSTMPGNLLKMLLKEERLWCLAMQNISSWWWQ